MTGPRLDLSPRDEGGYTLLVDGHDVSTAVASVELSVEPTLMPNGRLEVKSYATLTLHPGVAAHAGLKDAEVRIDADTHALLQRLGWTPPAGKGGGKP